MPIRSPATYTRKEFLDALLDACSSPAYTQNNAAQGFGPVQLVRVLVAREFHAPNSSGQKNVHYHAAVLGLTSFRFGCVKRALLEKHGMPTHWS